MILTLGTRENFLDIVEASDHAWAEVETRRAERVAAPRRRIECVEAGTKHLINKRFESDVTPPLYSFEPRPDVVI